MKLELVPVPVTDDRAKAFYMEPWGWFIYFSDPDGNTWSVHQIVPRE